jgi:hypothetical protein
MVHCQKNVIPQHFFPDQDFLRQEDQAADSLHLKGDNNLQNGQCRIPQESSRDTNNTGAAISRLGCFSKGNF